MTTKEMSIAVLDYIEQLEAERAALIAHLSLIRYADYRQPDVKQILADGRRNTLGTVQARNTELRQSILRADEQDAAETLLRGLTRE